MRVSSTMMGAAARLGVVGATLAVLTGLMVSGAAAKVRLTMYWHEAGPTLSELKKVVVGFEKENPDIVVSLIQGPGDWREYYNKFLLMSASNTPFDLAQITVAYPYFARRGVFADLTPFFRNSKLSIPSNVLDVFTLGGKKYGVPWGLFTNPMVVNKAAFETAGLPMVPQNWDDAEFTQDQFLAYGKKLTRDTNGDGRLDTFASYDLYGADFWAFGGDWVDPTGTKATANTKEMVDAFTWVNDLVRKYHIMPTPEDSGRLGLPWNAITTGKIGMNPFGNWGFASMKASKLRWDVAVTPKGTIRTNELSIDALGMGAASKRKKEAWRFIEYLYGSKTDLTQMCMAMAAIPSVRSALPVFKEMAAKQYPSVNWDCVIDAMNYGKTTTLCKVPVDSMVLENMRNEELAKMKSGRQSVQQALDNIQARFTKELSRRK